VMVHVQPSDIISNNTNLLAIGKETKSTVSDDCKVSLLFYNPPLMRQLELLETCFGCQEFC